MTGSLRSRAAVVVVVVFLVVATLYAFVASRVSPSVVSHPASANARAAGSATVTRRIVTARGRIEPESEVIGVGAAPDDRIGTIHVVEGQTVHAGDALVYLTTYEERQRERDYAASQLGDARTRLSAETAHGTSLIREMEVRIRQLDATQPIEIEAQRANVDTIESELGRAQADLERNQDMLKKGVIAPQVVDHSIAEVAQDESRLRNARATLERLQRDQTLNLEMARAQLHTAQTSLSSAQSLVQIRSLESNLQLAEARLARTIIRAPIDGLILKVQLHPGESVGQGPILKMGSTSQMFAVAEVYETDIGLIRVGQRARLSSGALARVVTGVVATIGRTIHRTTVLDVDPAADVDSRIIEVRVKLDESEVVASLTNLQVRIDIQIQ
nr:p-hydroxybenzoic acid efflux pump subunit AaeA [uncultured bacterium]